VLLLLDDAGLDAFPLGQRDQRLGALSDNKHVRTTRGESLAGSIFDVNDVMRAGMTLTILHETNTTDVTTRSDHAEIANVEFDEFDDLALQ